MVNELYHHGIKGQRWGVRRYQNEDGTLTDKGKKRFYKYDESGVGHLNRKGLKQNEKEEADFVKYTNSVRRKMEKNDPDFKKNLEDFKRADSKNKEYYTSERKKWADGTAYKGKNYYQFKDLSYEKWIKSEYGKQESRSFNAIRKSVEKAVKSDPAYKQSYNRLRNTDYSSKISWDNVEKINYGQEATNRILMDIRYNTK